MLCHGHFSPDFSPVLLPNAMCAAAMFCILSALLKMHWVVLEWVLGLRVWGTMVG